MESPTPDISVVLPALNEEKTIAECITKIKTVFSDLGIYGEIIIADSSTDRTPEIAASLGAVIVHPEQMGYGNAYLTGFAHARGRYIAIGDADDTYDFRELPQLLHKLDDGADLVMGSRLRGEIKSGAMPTLHRYIGNPVLTWLLNRLFGTTISDAHCGLRVIRRDALERLNLKTGGMEFASEMVIEAAKAGLRIDEVPITYAARVMPSKLSTFQDGWRHVRFMLLYRPVPFIAVPGLFFAIFGFSLMAFFLWQGEIETSRLHSFILAALAFIGGLHILLMGIMIGVYGAIHGYSTTNGIITKLMNYYSLERELFLGILLMIAGVVIGLFIVLDWIAAGFGEISQIANAVWSLALFLSGMQITFSAIFISMMLLRYERSEEDVEGEK
ncbi:MAG: glycosyltransferase [Methanocalculus sp. MSAO_Arc2]|nr:MAG: glycosyltransferase [Methanocalculus sp. MSAO_Arc2]